MAKMIGTPITITKGLGGSGGSLTTPDWNQNDETASDYVKNRTHYTSDPVETVLLEETSITTEGEDGYTPYDFVSESVEFIEGHTYFVTFNGTEYECVAYYNAYRGNVVIGNGSLIGIEGGNGEPFACDYYVGSGFYLITSEAGTYTLKIIGIIPEVVKLPVKYLPDGYPYKIANPHEIVYTIGGVDFWPSDNDASVHNYSYYTYQTIICPIVPNETYTVAVMNQLSTNPNEDTMIHANLIAYEESNGAICLGKNDSTSTFFMRITKNIDYLHYSFMLRCDSASNNITPSITIFRNGFDIRPADVNYMPYYNSRSRSEIFNDYENNRCYSDYCHAEGWNVEANGIAQHVQGKFNLVDWSGKYAHIVGNGTEDARSNAHTIDWEGNAWFAGKIYVGGTKQNDENAVEVALKTDIEAYITAALSKAY